MYVRAERNASAMASTDIPYTALAAAGAAAVVLMGTYLMRKTSDCRCALQQLRQAQDALLHEQEKRAADRAGRIKAEQQLKQLRLQLAVANTTQFSPQQQEQQHSKVHEAATAAAESSNKASGGSSSNDGQTAGTAMSVFPFTAIGTLRSCFSQRTGTPRQPHLVPAARAVLRLAPGIPSTCLEGLQNFSHCWVLYVFHENTDLAKLLAARASSSSSAHTAGVKSHIKVPRLNGAKMGVLATRSPHRPVPIGLSTAQIIQVDAAAGVLVLGGVDIVDGSPILDVKPYVPFSDALPNATAPDWVQVEATDEPLALGTVNMTPAVQQQLVTAWQAVQRRSLYKTPEQFTELVQQVLARDIRSLHQRTNVLPVHGKGQQQQQTQALPTAGTCAAASQRDDRPRDDSSSSNGGGSFGEGVGRYKVGLDGVCVSYDVCSQTGHIHIRGATVL